VGKLIVGISEKFGIGYKLVLEEISEKLWMLY